MRLGRAGCLFLLLGVFACGGGEQATPGEALSTGALSFSATSGGADPAAQTVNVTNSGKGTLAIPTAAISYGSGSGWLSAEVSGSAAPFTVTVQPHLAGLAAGTYDATVTLTSAGATGSPAHFTVQLTLGQAPAMTLSTRSLSFQSRVNGTVAAQIVTVSNSGGGTLATPSLSISSPDGSAWVADLASAGTGDTISIHPDLTGLVAGTYQATVTVTCAGASNSPQSIAASVVVTPWANLTNGQAAAVVLGQPDFVSNAQSTPPTASTTGTPWASPAVIDGRLYLTSYGDNRVLGFNGVPTVNGAAGDFAIGQPDLVSNTSGTSNALVSHPEQVSSANGKLALVDAGNDRVLIWNHVPTTSDVPAEVVVGEPDTTTATGGCTASMTSTVEGGILAGNKLIVSDTGNSRVLIWNSVPTTDGQSADVVLGQPDFTTCSGAGTVSASSLNRPESVWSDGTRLLVADAANNRILIWNTFPTTNGQPADLVLGQADFTSSGTGGSRSGLDWPISVACNGTQLAVADNSNNRVLVWNAFPTSNGAPADVVIGQADFTGVSSNGGSSTPTASTLSSPGGVTFWNDALIVGEWTNNRYLIFR